MEDFLLQNLFWLLCAALSTGGLAWTFARAGRVNMSPQAATLLVSRGNGVFLDIRPAADYATGHIPRSQNIPESELPGRMASLEKFKKKPIVVVCPNGMRARRAAQQLLKDGFEGACALAGGVAGWRDANLPLFGAKGKGK